LLKMRTALYTLEYSENSRMRYGKYDLLLRLASYSFQLEVCLSFAQKLPTSPDSQYILSNRNTMKEFRLKAVRLTGDYCAKESESSN
jgi:hypothetical protein